MSTRTRRLLVTLHRRENHGSSMRGICEALALLAARGDTEVVFPVHPNPAVQTVVRDVLQDVDGVHLCEPLDYLARRDDGELRPSSSPTPGGLQEEAPSLGKPVLVLRDTTERPEAIEAGVARLVGTLPEDVHAAASHLLDDRDAYEAMARPANPFGDGSAAAHRRGSPSGTRSPRPRSRRPPHRPRRAPAAAAGSRSPSSRRSSSPSLSLGVLDRGTDDLRRCSPVRPAPARPVPDAATWPAEARKSRRTLVLYDRTGQWGWLGELYATMTANLVGHFGPPGRSPSPSTAPAT